MKKVLLLPLTALALLFLSACAPQSPAQSGPTLSAAGKPGSSAQSAPATTPVSQPVSSDSGAEVDVTLADNTIQSSVTTFKAGVPYRFIIINNGRHQHNFNINPPVTVAGSLDAALSKALLSVDQNQLPIGGGTTVTYTFPASAVGQELEMSCLIRRHYELGMRLSITVTN
jgi:uncharacterized cupredoxin-like copper-binding protein